MNIRKEKEIEYAYLYVYVYENEMKRGSESSEFSIFKFWHWGHICHCWLTMKFQLEMKWEKRNSYQMLVIQILWHQTDIISSNVKSPTEHTYKCLYNIHIDTQYILFSIYMQTIHISSQWIQCISQCSSICPAPEFRICLLLCSVVSVARSLTRSFVHSFMHSFVLLVGSSVGRLLCSNIWYAAVA